MSFCSLEPALPPREIRKSSENGTCLVLIWKAPYHSSVDNRTFPAKVCASEGKRKWLVIYQILFEFAWASIYFC